MTAPENKAGSRSWLSHAKNAGIAVFAQASYQVSTFVVVILAARYLAPHEYGTYTLAVALVTLLQTLSYTGFFQYVVTSKGDDAAIVSTAFWLTLASSVIGCAALFAATPAIARAFGAPELESVLSWLVALQPTSTFAAWGASVMLRRGRTRPYFGIMLAENLVALVAGVLALVAWQSVWSLVVYRAVRIGIGALLYAAFLREWPGLKAGFAEARRAISYATGLYGTSVVAFGANYGADIVLGLHFSTEEAGLYRFGARLASAVSDIVRQPMRSFALVRFGAANRTGEPFGPLLRGFATANVLLIGFVAAGTVVFAGPVIGWAFQPSYLAALGVTTAMAVRALAGVGNQLVEPVLASKGYTGRVMAHHTFWMVTNITIVILFASWGMTTLAWAQVAVTACASLGATWLISKHVAIRPILGGVVAATIVVVGYATAAWTLARAFGTTFLDPSVVGSGAPPRSLSLVMAVLTCSVAGLAVLAACHRAKLLELKIFAADSRP